MQREARAEERKHRVGEDQPTRPKQEEIKRAETRMTLRILMLGRRRGLGLRELTLG